MSSFCSGNNTNCWKPWRNLKQDPATTFLKVSKQTTANSRWVSHTVSQFRMNNPNTAGCDRDISVPKSLRNVLCFHCREGCPRQRSPLHCMLPWRSCQTGGTLCRSGWLSCSSSALETRSCTCLLMTWTSGTLTTPGIWGHLSTERWRWGSGLFFNHYHSCKLPLDGIKSTVNPFPQQTSLLFIAREAHTLFMALFYFIVPVGRDSKKHAKYQGSEAWIPKPPSTLKCVLLMYMSLKMLN